MTAWGGGRTREVGVGEARLLVPRDDSGRDRRGRGVATSGAIATKAAGRYERRGGQVAARSRVVRNPAYVAGSAFSFPSASTTVVSAKRGAGKTTRRRRGSAPV